MEKKYQVFVSSTYEDLQEERKKVMEALLQMNCFPVGMDILMLRIHHNGRLLRVLYVSVTITF